MHDILVGVQTNGRTDKQMDGRTNPHVENWRCQDASDSDKGYYRYFNNVKLILWILEQSEIVLTHIEMRFQYQNKPYFCKAFAFEVEALSSQNL